VQLGGCRIVRDSSVGRGSTFWFTVPFPRVIEDQREAADPLRGTRILVVDEEAVARQVRMQGWIRTRRDSKGGFSFLELNDGSCQGNVQVVAPGELPNYESQVKHLHTGASVVIDGEVKASPAKGQATEVQAQAITVHGGADAANVVPTPTREAAAPTTTVPNVIETNDPNRT